jgi:N-acetylmuramoyl-L-alanine amidase
MERLKPIRRIIISVGHGGLKGEKFDTGAVNAQGVTENAQCRIIAGYLCQELLTGGYPVLLLPDIGLVKTLDYLKRNGNAQSDWAIELHKDSANYKAETMHRRCGLYYFAESSSSSAVSRQMINCMVGEGAHGTSWSRADTDSPRKYLGFVRELKMLSHIAELGFIEGDTSDGECRWYAQALARSILKVLELSKD